MQTVNNIRTAVAPERETSALAILQMKMRCLIHYLQAALHPDWVTDAESLLYSDTSAAHCLYYTACHPNVQH